MRSYYERKGSTLVHITDLHAEPDPTPRPMNSAYLEKRGFKTEPGNIYVKDDVRVHYDGASWWVFYFCAMFRIETIEQFEKLIV